MKEKCREYLCRDNVPQGKGIEDATCRLLHLCRYCYRMKFPVRGPSALPSHRRNAGGQWVDIRPQMSWWPENSFVRQGEEQEVQESRELLPEELDE